MIHLMAAAEAAAVVPEKEPTPTACKWRRDFDTNAVQKCNYHSFYLNGIEIVFKQNMTLLWSTNAQLLAGHGNQM